METALQTNMANIHSSQLDTMNQVRQELWNSVYNKYITLQYFIDQFRRVFGDDIVINFDLVNMSFSIKTNGEPESNVVINSKLLDCYKTAINNLHIDDKISHDLYYKCIQNPNLLYNLDLNHNNFIIVKV